MATKAILQTVAQAELGNKGLVISVQDNEDILGHLMVGRASLVWFEKNAKKRGRKVNWKDFEQWMMDKPASPAERP